MVLAILSPETSNRRCSYSHAMTLPFASTMVDTAGTWASRSWAEPLATTWAARLGISPRPPANGNNIAVATPLASRQHPASLRTVRTAGGRSDMRTTVAARHRPAAPSIDQLRSSRGDPNGQALMTSQLGVFGRLVCARFTDQPPKLGTQGDVWSYAEV